MNYQTLIPDLKRECLLHSQLPTHMPVDPQHKSFARIRFSVLSFQRKLATNSFSVVLLASGLVSLQQSTIESNKLNFMMKYHSDVLPTKFELATRNNNRDIAIFVQPG